MHDVRAAPQIDLDILDWDRQYTTLWQLETAHVAQVQVYPMKRKWCYSTGILHGTNNITTLV